MESAVKGGEPTDGELCARAKAGDREAVGVLVERHTPLVVELAKRTGLTGADLDDLVQDGLLGIAKAAVKWNPDSGSKFSTYAFIVVRNAITNGYKALKRGGEAIAATDREGFNLQLVARPDPEVPDAGAVLALLTPLERGLITLMWGLEGEPVSVTRAAKRFGLTVRQAQEIIESAFLRLRKSTPKEEEG